jgi:hypothetical protein
MSASQHAISTSLGCPFAHSVSKTTHSRLSGQTTSPFYGLAKFIDGVLSFCIHSSDSAHVWRLLANVVDFGLEDVKLVIDPDSVGDEVTDGDAVFVVLAAAWAWGEAVASLMRKK